MKHKVYEFEIDDLEINLSNSGEIDIYTNDFYRCCTHLKYFEAKALAEIFVTRMDDPLIYVTAKQWEQIKTVAQKYLNNKVFL